MYAARYEMAGVTWSVCAGRVRQGTVGVVPPELLSALAEGRFDRLAVRCHFAASGLRASVLVPLLDAAARVSPQATLGPFEDIEWCRDAAEFDAMTDELGPCQLWLDSSGFSVRGLSCPVDASWLPDWALFRRLGARMAFTHQINIARRPPGTEELRLMRKHLARLELLAEDDDWPAARLQAQRRVVERRLASPWLIDELIACDSEADCRVLHADLHHRLLEQGGTALADAAPQPGQFDELLHTGLDSASFMEHAAVAGAGRSVATGTLWAALGQSDATGGARVFDAFVSHATADAEMAERLCGRLEAAGLRCWIAPRDIAAGHHYAEVIDDALRQSRAIVLLMSAAAMASEHVLRELERAVNYRGLVLPVRLAAIEPQRAYRYLLSGCQWTDALPGSDEQALVQRLLVGLGPAR